MMTLDEIADIYDARFRHLSRNRIPCPKCSHEQQQLTNMHARPAMWKCRICKHAYTHEPKEENLISINIRPGANFFKLPEYQTEGSSGLDLFAGVQMTLNPKCWGLISCGFSLEIPRGWEAQIRPRSGIAMKKGVTVLNSPGTIDSDYRGDVGVILINHGVHPFQIERGDRIAQMVLCEVGRIRFERVAILSDTARGEGGYGSTGTR